MTPAPYFHQTARGRDGRSEGVCFADVCTTARFAWRSNRMLCGRGNATRACRGCHDKTVARVGSRVSAAPSSDVAGGHTVCGASGCTFICQMTRPNINVLRGAGGIGGGIAGVASCAPADENRRPSPSNAAAVPIAVRANTSDLLSSVARHPKAFISWGNKGSGNRVSHARPRYVRP